MRLLSYDYARAPRDRPATPVAASGRRELTR